MESGKLSLGHFGGHHSHGGQVCPPIHFGAGFPFNLDMLQLMVKKAKAEAKGTLIGTAATSVHHFRLLAIALLHNMLNLLLVSAKTHVLIKLKVDDIQVAPTSMCNPLIWKHAVTTQ